MQTYIPLNQRSAAEIRAQSEKYREMATTARTAVTKRGLESLAVRMAALADKREAAEARARFSAATQDDAASLSNAAD